MVVNGQVAQRIANPLTDLSLLDRYSAGLCSSGQVLALKFDQFQKLTDTRLTHLSTSGVRCL